MKLSFSTVGCPHWRWGEITATAKDLGYSGIELRGLGDDLFLPEVKIFQPEHRADTLDGLKKHGLAIACVASYCQLHKNDRNELAATRDTIELAAALEAPFVRVLGDSWGEPGTDVDEALVAERLKALAPYAAEKNVTLLVESNGVWSNTAKLAALLNDVNSDAVAALWDVWHPIRNYAEAPSATYANIGQWVRHVHLKDARGNGLKMLGYGDLPLVEILRLLKSGGYDGYLSAEWTKRWNADLEDPGVVFAHYVYMAQKLWGQA